MEPVIKPKNENKRDCVHSECPYRYCRHHKYWDDTEQDRLSSLQNIIVATSDNEVMMCYSYMDI